MTTGTYTEQRIKKVKGLKALGELTKAGLVGTSQAAAILHGMKGEEQGFFFDKMIDTLATFNAMPKTYETQGVEDKTAILHYFYAGADWYIVEKDRGDGCGDTQQTQAFGLASMPPNYPELGYINIAELTWYGAELDLYFTPAPLSKIKAELSA